MFEALLDRRVPRRLSSISRPLRLILTGGYLIVSACGGTANLGVVYGIGKRQAKVVSVPGACEPGDTVVRICGSPAGGHGCSL